MSSRPEEPVSESQMRHLVDLAAHLQDVPDEDRIYVLLGQGLRQVLPDGTVINISNYGSAEGKYSSQLLLGLGPFVDKLMGLLGRRPEELSGDYTPKVKAAKDPPTPQ